MMTPKQGNVLRGRYLEFFHHGTEPEWGYEKEQEDSFAILHPKDERPGEVYPLYVVFHSAGQDVYSAIATLLYEGSHDVFHTPENTYTLFLDCRMNEANDWWWGGVIPFGNAQPQNHGVKPRPVENRCIATVEWTMANYPVDPDRVYGVGSSMGGSGALGICLPRGDIFAAIRLNVPAGVVHAADRCCLVGETPDGFTIPDPPIVVDYSAQNDVNSIGHDVLFAAMREKKYPYVAYWGNFGHQGNESLVEKENDLIRSFDIMSVRKNEAYPVFTSASSDDVIPWLDESGMDRAGQVNAFFRWEVLTDTADEFAVSLRLLRQDEWQSRVTFPTASTADVTLRRLQSFRPAPGESISYAFGDASGVIAADEAGVPTVPAVTVTTEPTVLRISK